MTSAPGRTLRQRMVHVAGMSRGGTTYLYHTLQQHPQLFVPLRKEICYFGHNHARGFDWFADFYRDIEPQQKAVDICGLYFMDEQALDRILEFSPTARVILSLREPVEWIYSMFEHYGTLWDVPPLPEFVSGCVWHRDGQDIPLAFAGGVIERTVERFRGRLGDRLLTLDFALLGRDPLRMLSAIERFLGIESYFSEGNFSTSPVNQRGGGSARWVASLSKLPAVDRVARAVPRSLVLRARRLLESSGRRSTSAGPVYSEADRRFVEQALASDRRFVHALFERSPVWIGREPVEPR